MIDENNLDKWYCAEYSISQGAWHIDKLENVIQKNEEMKDANINNDYKIIYISDNEKKLRERIIKKIKEEE